MKIVKDLQKDLVKDLSELSTFVKNKQIDGYYVMVICEGESYYYNYNYKLSPACMLFYIDLTIQELKQNIIDQINDLPDFIPDNKGQLQ